MLLLHHDDKSFNTAFQKPLSSAVKPHALPVFVDRKSDLNGRLGSISSVHRLKGFKWDPAWKPIDKKGNRACFVHVPALVSTQSGASVEFDFNGTALGLFITSGPMPGALNSISATPDFVHWRHSHAGVEVFTSPEQ